MRCMVTEGTGFSCSNLIKRLLDQGEVVGLDNVGSYYKSTQNVENRGYILQE